MNRNQLCLGQQVKQITSDLNVEEAVFRSSQLRETVYSMFVPQHYERNYAYPLLIWLHNAGDDNGQLRRVMPLISMRNYAGIAPRGTCLVDDVSKGYTWDQTADGIMRAQRAVTDCIAAAQNRFHIAERRVFLVGVGAGGSMAMRVGFSRPELFAGVVSLGGPFPAGNNPLQCLSTIRDLPTLIAHGRDSVRYREDDVCDDLRLLHTAGVSVTLRQYPCADELIARMLTDIDTWMMEIVTGTASQSASGISPISDSSS